MPEHMHLLLGKPEVGVLADAVKLSVLLPQDSDGDLMKRYHDRFGGHNAMVEVLRYVHRNPVMRG